MLSPAVTQHQKGTKFNKRNRNLLAHIIELSTAVVEVDIKVTNVNLTQNQCLQCVPRPLTHVEIPRPRDANELNNDGMIKLGDVHYQTDPNLSISQKRFNQRWLPFLFAYPVSNWLAVSCFSFWEAFAKCPPSCINGIFDSLRNGVAVLV